MTRNELPHNESGAESDNKENPGERHWLATSSLAPARKKHQGAACCEQSWQPRTNDRARYGKQRETGNLPGRVTSAAIDHPKEVRSAKIGERRQRESRETTSKIEIAPELNEAAGTGPICVNQKLKEGSR